MACPLCACPDAKRSWLGSTFYRDKEFSYLECLRCHSLYCHPMPDDQTLAQMYGPEYGTTFALDGAAGGLKGLAPVLELLKRDKPGTFVDYGCGTGGLLVEAVRLGWRAIGVEFDDKVAESVTKRTRAQVVTPHSKLLTEPLADVLHLGDVIEHLTQVDGQLQNILGLIKPGGLLVAQGPLENNNNLFTAVLRMGRSLWRQRRRVEMAPYHVMLATARGQRLLFERFGLKELEYTLQEVAWPAPSNLSLADLTHLRAVGLFTLRRCSQLASALRPHQWGNRYYYLGRWNGGR